MTETQMDRRVEALRRFNRFYTRQVGLLQYLQSPFSLSEVRVLYELAHREGLSASGLAAELGLDPGYLSRILARFGRRGLVARRLSATDGRQRVLSLTPRGRKAFGPLEARSREEIARLLGKLSGREQARLVSAAQTIEELLGGPEERTPSYVLRPPNSGDLGWVVHRHGALYAQEFGFTEEFERLVAEIVGRFMAQHDPKRERCWIAERDGEVVGSVFLVKHSKRVAQLRLLLVEPTARGLGIGARLVEECARFARLAGYRKITLWTNSVLVAARRIYRAAGYRRVRRERHHSFGHDLIGETWELVL